MGRLILKVVVVGILAADAVDGFRCSIGRGLGRSRIRVQRMADSEENGSGLPSDTSVADENLEGYNQPYVANDEDRRAIKSEIFRIGATTDRGQVH